jgi:ribonuclease HII
MRAFRRLAEQALVCYPDSLVVIDGGMGPSGLACIPIEKGDDLVPAISAASILAKVSRDRLMFQYDKEYPQYGFFSHVGYGTQRHKDAIARFGVTPIHRRISPLRDLVDRAGTIKGWPPPRP